MTEDSFELLLRTLDELGGEDSDDPDAHIARVCAYNVLVAAMPGERSQADQDTVLWHVIDLARDLAKRGSPSAGRAAWHAAELIEKIDPGHLMSSGFGPRQPTQNRGVLDVQA